MTSSGDIKKINIQSCEILKDAGTYKTYKILDTEGNRYGATELFDVGEQEVMVEVNGQYTNLKKIKPKQTSEMKGFMPKKDFTFEKKKAALDASVSLINSGKISADRLMDSCDKIYDWLK